MKRNFVVIEGLGIALCVTLQLVLLYRVVQYGITWWVALISIIVALLLADVLSGLMHWIGDTWGDENVPIIGKMLIGPFREHHIFPMAITTHDFFETNGNSFIFAVVVAFPALFISSEHSGVILFLLMSSFALGMTNQTHKWSHTMYPSWIGRLLQWLHLTQTPEAHAVHHLYPFIHSYNITNGWLNPLMDKLHIYRGLEAVITKMTGAIPRSGDSQNFNSDGSPKASVLALGTKY